MPEPWQCSGWMAASTLEPKALKKFAAVRRCDASQQPLDEQFARRLRIICCLGAALATPGHSGHT